MRFERVFGYTYRIETSVDLSTWTTIDTVTVGASGVVDFEDTNSSAFSRRFYRTATPDHAPTFPTVMRHHRRCWAGFKVVYKDCRKI